MGGEWVSHRPSALTVRMLSAIEGLSGSVSIDKCLQTHYIITPEINIFTNKTIKSMGNDFSLWHPQIDKYLVANQSQSSTPEPPSKEQHYAHSCNSSVVIEGKPRALISILNLAFVSTETFSLEKVHDEIQRKNVFFTLRWAGPKLDAEMRTSL